MRALREDVQNNLLSIDHSYLGQSLPIPLLGGLKLIVKYDDVRPLLLGPGCYLLRFARSDEVARTRLGDPDELLFRYWNRQCFHQRLQFVQEARRFFFLGWSLEHSNQERFFNRLRLFADIKHTSA